MAAHIPQQVIDLFNDPGATKVLATLDEDGSPHLAVKQSLGLSQEGKLFYLELLESSRTNRNMVRSIWFDKPVSVIVRGEGDRCFQIRGKAVKTHIAGPVFREHYQELRRQLGDLDVAAVWVIEPDTVIDQSLVTRRAEEEARFPFFNHLDRLVKPAGPES